MADALKAEGNKAFAAKNFDEAMYVQAATEPNVVLTYVFLQRQVLTSYRA
jgi:hypothetical protein